MHTIDRHWPALLEERPEAPFWDGVSRGELERAVLQRAADLRAEGRSPGDRYALEPDADAATAVEILAALHAELAVLLLPRREPTAVKESLGADAGARTGGESGTVWIRSSGSLGQPRWIIHTPATLLAGAAAAAAHLDFGPGARWRVALPLDHVGGLSLVFRALAGGGALTTGDDATHTSLVATQLGRLLDGGADLRGLRCALLGGGPVPTALRRRAVTAGVPLVVSYGLTETGAVAASSALDEAPDVLCSDHFAGRPLLAGTVDVTAGGDVRVGGPALCVATAGDGGVAAPLDLAGGWLATGDLGRLDDGDLFVTGRRDNLIISGGEKLPAEELEAALLALAGVDEAVVVPVDDDEFGQRPVAFVRWRDGVERTTDSVRADLAASIAGWKRPVAVWPLPDTARLKPDRAALRRRAAELRDR